MMAGLSRVGAFAGLGALAVFVIIPAQPGERAGQTLFLPASRMPVIEDSVLGVLVITSCEESRDGLYVTGRVQPVAGPQQVWVTGGARELPGVRVGSAALGHAERRFGAGDFRVTLPWATAEAGLALVQSDSAGRLRRGPILQCPGRRGATF